MAQWGTAQWGNSQKGNTAQRGKWCWFHNHNDHDRLLIQQKDLGTLLLIPFTVGEVFQEKGTNCRFNIDVIVHVASGEHASVKAHLGDDTFDGHFTDMNDGSKTHCIMDIELLHYLDTLIDQHLSNQAALLMRFAVDLLSKSPHSAKLFFDTSWVFGLAMKTRDNQILHQYTPHSDVFLSIKGFLHVLLEISSDKQKKRDKCRMLLQASCLICLGNMLISDKSPTFFMKAFYIDNDYHVEEFTLYQRHHKSGPGDDKLTQMGESMAPKMVPAALLNGGTSKALKKVLNSWDLNSPMGK
ncbi:hypothetical protein EDB89DRAFT_1907743 [Lactarius sanguifluus]|nr:hypothetical protein EDB89DRAFT_1907743 [Lactarius sanguifluus]